MPDDPRLLSEIKVATIVASYRAFINVHRTPGEMCLGTPALDLPDALAGHIQAQAEQIERLRHSWEDADGEMPTMCELCKRPVAWGSRHPECGVALAEIERLRAQIHGFYDVLAHGDEKHRRWLREMVDKHFELEADDPV